MVVFTCNHCGESLQKPRVEKHYFTVCKKPKSLTCVDCFKDFKNEEFAVHTKCISEEERYAAKGTFAETIVKKGEMKQESWTEMIRSIVDTERNMPFSLKNLFKTISSFTNVPRKKVKFMNFLKSTSGGRINLNDIEAAWDLIEKYKAKTNPKPLPAVNNGNELKTDTLAEAPVENPLPKKKKKRSKADEAAEIQTSEVKDEDKKLENSIYKTTDIADEPPKKKKKHSKVGKTNENNTDGVVQDEVSSLTALVNISEKSEVVESKNSQIENECNVAATLEKPKKKKKKSKRNSEVALSGITNGTESSKNISKKFENETKADTVSSTEIVENEVEIPIEKSGHKHKIGADDAPLKKKKKNKQQNADITLSEITNCTDSAAKYNKKSEEKAQASSFSTEAIENGAHKHETVEIPSKKKKKGNQNGNEACGNGVAVINEDQNKSSGTFCFKDTILSILRNQNSISTKKLQKKVLGIYLKETGNTEFTGKTIKTYNKKLKQLPNVTTQNDIVTLNEG